MKEGCMRNFLLGLFVAASLLSAGQTLAQDKGPKETFFVVKLTGFDKNSTIELFSATDLKELQKKLALESRVLQEAYKQAIIDWSKTAKEKKKSAVFPISQQPPARALRVLFQSTDSEKCGKSLDSYVKKNDEEQKKADKVIADKKAKITDEKRKKKLEEREADLAYALQQFISKVDELATKEAEKPGATPVL
jgi:hypothetical protein